MHIKQWKTTQLTYEQVMIAPCVISYKYIATFNRIYLFESLVITYNIPHLLILCELSTIWLAR